MSNYTSPAMQAMPVFGTQTYPRINEQVDGHSRQFGYSPRDWKSQPFGSTAKPFHESFQIIPRNEWSERIEANENEKATLADLVDYAKIPVKDQNGLGHCWAYGTVTAFEIARAKANLPYIEFSPDSVAAPINNYRNQGGWGANAIAYMQKHGVLPASVWPYHHYRDNSPEDKTLRAENKIIEFYDVIDPSMNANERLDAVVSASLQGFSCSVAYSWWGHLVASLDPVIEGRNKYALMILNSWGERWGKRGKGILSGSKAIPDECEAIRVASM